MPAPSRRAWRSWSSLAHAWGRWRGVSWRGGSGTVVNAGKHGVVVEANGANHKLFWDEIESVEKAGKHGESTGKTEEPLKEPWKPSQPGMVEPAKPHKALEAAGWKVTAKGCHDQLRRAPE